MPTRTARDAHYDNGVIGRLDRRVWPIVVSVVFVSLGLAYIFRWGPVVQHVPSLWIAPVDLVSTNGSATQFAHGHFSAIYRSTAGFLAYPGILIALAPIAALSNVFHATIIEIKVNHHLVAHPPVLFVRHVPSLYYLGPSTSRGNEYVFQPQEFVGLVIIALALSCVSLFAFDALADRLQVSRSRRAVLCVAEAVVLWNVTVIWGHPEDAVAVALGVYALLFAMDERFTGAGWSFGAALAFQPLIVMVFPILLVMGGKKRVVGLVIRGVIPAAAVTVGPLVADFHDTVHTLVTQPALPDRPSDHQTPWTFLAPREGGTGAKTTVGGGPMRVLVLAFAAGVGWWARRWRERPEMIAWAAALALALRIYVETVNTPYYIWPTLAVGLSVAARASTRRFGIAIVMAILTTVIAQWQLSWLPWWIIDVAGVTGFLVVASRPEPLVPLEQRLDPGRARTPPVVPGRGGSGAAKKKRRKTARTDRKRSARR